MDTRRLAVCADDYGQGAAIDRGILALAERGRITALSCLVTTPRWPAAAGALQGSRCATGLHFNLTDGEPVSAALRRHWPVFPRLGVLLAQAFLGRLPVAAVGAELHAQLERFTEARGQAPGFIDGHQHVHALPGVRPHVLALARELAVPLRNTARIVGPGFAVKRAILAGCGGRALAAEARALGVAQPTALLGVHDFDPEVDYRHWMRGWLRTAPDGALLFCHPASGPADPADPIAAARAREMAYLASEAFTVDLVEAGVRLG